MLFTKLQRQLRALLVAPGFLSLVLAGVPCSAQRTEPEILAQLKDKPLFLRGCWSGSDLSFDHRGKPVQGYSPQSFTLSGIDVEKVRVGSGSLEIQGQRVGLEFGKDGSAQRVRLKWRHFNGKVVIHIAGQAGDDFGDALTAVFAPDLPTLIPSMEQYWLTVGKQYVRESAVDDQDPGENVTDDGAPVPKAGISATTDQAKGRPSHIGGSVRPPVLVSQGDPAYTDAARGLRYSAKVEVYLWVGPSGVPEHLMVKRPAGLGLDEAAMAAVATYRFKPATRNGQPVKVDLYVDVNFQIF